MLEWLLNADLTELQEVLRVTVMTGRLHHRLPYRPAWDPLTSNRPWIETSMPLSKARAAPMDQLRQAGRSNATNAAR